MQFLEKLKPLALLLMRFALGIVLISHGYPKLFGQTGPYQQLFSRVGLPASWVYVSGALELFGGALLIVGLFTRAIALLLTVEIAVAIWKVHLAHGVLSVKDYEFPLMVAVACFALAAVGAGAVSLDQPLYRGRATTRSKGKS